MADYGHDLLFGTFITPVADQADRTLALAQLTEEAGLDLVTVQDHPYQARFLDTWTLLSVIAARTTRVRVAPTVANLPLRQPAMLARSAASLDLLSGGRVELGLGAGAFWDAIAAMGGGRLTPAESVEALAEGIEIIRSVWDAGGGTVKVDGRHHRVWGVHPGPAPAHPIGIWLGAYKKRMLGVTGRLADGWLPSSPYAPPEQLPAMNAAIDAAARQAGRDPAAVRRLYNISGTFGSGDGFLTGKTGRLGQAARRTDPGAGLQWLPAGQRRPGHDPPVRRRGGAGGPRPGRRRPQCRSSGFGSRRPGPRRRRHHPHSRRRGTAQR